MALIAPTEIPLFVEGEIVRGDLIRAWHYSWDGPRNGLVFASGPREIRAIFMPGVHTAYAYFTIKAKDVADGDWDITYSHDFTTVHDDVKMDETKRAAWGDDIDGIEAVTKEEIDGIFAGEKPCEDTEEVTEADIDSLFGGA